MDEYKQKINDQRFLIETQRTVIATLQAENDDLRRGIVDNKELAMTMMPTDLLEKLQADYERLRSFLEGKMATAKVSADNENYFAGITIKEIEQVLKGHTIQG